MVGQEGWASVRGIWRFPRLHGVEYSRSMLPDLSRRADNLHESMNDPNCSREKLFRTYREFALTNRLLAGWRRSYVSLIRPHLRAGEEFTLLDIGFGGGDIPRTLSAWVRRDGFQLEITGIEQDARALEYVSTLPKRGGVTFREASLDDLLCEKRMFDFVISNHVLHELTNREVGVFRDQVEALTRRRSIMSDIARSFPGYLLFASTVPLYIRSSFTVPDGLISIRRSFTRDELQSALGPRWRVWNAAWFRLIATFTGSSSGAKPSPDHVDDTDSGCVAKKERGAVPAEDRRQRCHLPRQ